MDIIKIAIIGMGKMGQIRYDSFLRHKGFEVVAICDISEDNLKGYNNIAKFSNWSECLENTDAQAIMVCTFNNSLADIVCRALELGKHVFSEKPPGRNLEETKRMQSVHSKTDKILKFGFNHRYHNSVIEAKTLIDSKLLGDLVCARGVYGKAGSDNFASEWRNDLSLSGGGILLDQGIHMLDLLCYFMGDFTSVDSSVNRLVWEDIQAEDSAFAILKTDNGKIASLHSSAIQWKHKFDLDLIFTDGYAALNGLLTSTLSYGEERITYYRKDLNKLTGKMGNPLEHTMCFNEDNSWDYEACEFYDSVVNSKPLLCGSIDDAINVMSLIEKIYNSGS